MGGMGCGRGLWQSLNLENYKLIKQLVDLGIGYLPNYPNALLTNYLATIYRILFSLTISQPISLLKDTTVKKRKNLKENIIKFFSNISAFGFIFCILK